MQFIATLKLIRLITENLKYRKTTRINVIILQKEVN